MSTGSLRKEIPPSKNANIQPNVNSSDPEGLGDTFNVTQLSSGRASSGQSSVAEQLPP